MNERDRWSTRPAPRVTVSSIVDDTLTVARAVAPNGVSGGACDLDRARAVRRALGECVERVSHLAAAESLPVLTSPGDRVALKPSRLMRRARTRAADDRVSNWVVGHGILHGHEVAVPAQAVFLGWAPRPPEARWWVQTSVGTAAAGGHDRARLAALREVIERHVLILGWRDGGIRFEDLSHLHRDVLPAGMLSALHGHGVSLRSLRVVDSSPDLVIAMLYRAGGKALTCGAALRGDTVAAMRHAVCEAVAVRLALRSGLEPCTQDRDRRRGWAVANAGPEHLAFVSERTAGRGDPREAPDDLEALLAAAESRFAGEPIDFELPPTNDLLVHRVVCPDSAVFAPPAEGNDLTCPIA